MLSMRRRYSPILAGLLAAACGDLSTVAPPAGVAAVDRVASIASPYEAVDLGTLGNFAEASAINEAGQIVGFGRPGTGLSNRAFFWENGVMTELPSLGGTDDRPSALNNSGMAVGTSGLADQSGAHAVIWLNGTLTDINPAGARYSQAVAVNDAGQVALWAQFETGIRYRGYLWENGVLTELGTPYGRDVFLWSINERGQILGQVSGNESNTQVAFIWHNGTYTELESYDGGATIPQDINDAGLVTGSAWITDRYRAALWNPGTSLTLLDMRRSTGRFITNAGDVGGSVAGGCCDLGAIWKPGQMARILPLIGGAWTYVSSMNDAGLVAGVGANANGQSRALLWEDGAMLELPLLSGGTEAYTAYGRRAMNERGFVVGSSTVGNGQYHAVLWRPAAPPEPVTCSVTPSEIWPPSGELVPVRVTVTGGSPVLRSVTNNETGAADAEDWTLGGADLAGSVLAARLGSGNGRTYTIAYDVVNTAGVHSRCEVSVSVPHDQGK